MISRGTAGTRIEYRMLLVCGGAEESETVNSKTYGSLRPAVGVPVIFPSVETERPGGKSPLDLLHERVPKPPLALTSPESMYGVPTFPGFKTFTFAF